MTVAAPGFLAATLKYLPLVAADAVAVLALYAAASTFHWFVLPATCFALPAIAMTEGSLLSMIRLQVFGFDSDVFRFARS